MGQASPFKPLALVVEDEAMQREVVVRLLQQSGMRVVECDSAEAALGILDRLGVGISMLFTDVHLAGEIDGIALANFAKKRFPDMHVVVTSGMARGDGLSKGAKFLSKPWRVKDLLSEAASISH
jgi:two-component system cell cycle response regulator CpdR